MIDLFQFFSLFFFYKFLCFTFYFISFLLNDLLSLKIHVHFHLKKSLWSRPYFKSGAFYDKYLKQYFKTYVSTTDRKRMFQWIAYNFSFFHFFVVRAILDFHSLSLSLTHFLSVKTMYSYRWFYQIKN